MKNHLFRVEGQRCCHHGFSGSRACSLGKRWNAESEVAIAVDDECERIKDGSGAGGGSMWSRPASFAMKVREPKVKL